MRFCSGKVLGYIMEGPRDGLVATMRTWRYRAGQRVVLKDCDGKVIGYGVIAGVYPSTRDELEKWLPYSGFGTAEDWAEEARRLHRGRLPGTIYIVRVIRVYR